MHATHIYAQIPGAPILNLTKCHSKEGSGTENPLPEDVKKGYTWFGKIDTDSCAIGAHPQPRMTS